MKGKKELDKRAKYPKMIEEQEVKAKTLYEQVRVLEDKEKDIEYAHCLELLEKDKQAEAAKAEIRQEQEERVNKLREKYEAELEKLREKNEAAKSWIQESIVGK